MSDLWQVMPGQKGGFWVTLGRWEPGHPESIVATFQRREDAEYVATLHNNRVKALRVLKPREKVAR